MSSCPVGNALTERRPTSLPPPPKKASELILREPAQAVAAPGAAEEREEGERAAAGATYSRCLAAAPFGSSREAAASALETAAPFPPSSTASVMK